MRNRARFHIGLSLFVGLAWDEVMGAQEPATVPQQPPPQQQVLPAQASKNAAVPCVEPPPVVSLKDYNGPLKKAVGVFGRALERKSVHPPYWWLGTVSAVTLSNAYHPGNERGIASVGIRVGYSVIQDMGSDVLREFWPEISRKLQLPFRGEHEVRTQESVPGGSNAPPDAN
jgi:hypothetical protein